MKIEKKILEDIINKMPDKPPEVGGILGGKDNIVSQYHLDLSSSNGGCYYSPNVQMLNEVIRNWSVKKIDFLGLFHTHFWGVSTLSDGDIEYITRIMQAMPKHIKQLFFPIIVIPDRMMVSYVAVRDENKINIINDDLIIV